MNSCSGNKRNHSYVDTNRINSICLYGIPDMWRDQENVNDRHSQRARAAFA